MILKLLIWNWMNLVLSVDVRMGIDKGIIYVRSVISLMKPVYLVVLRVLLLISLNLDARMLN